MERDGICREAIRVLGLMSVWMVVGLVGSNAALAAHAYLWSDPIKTANRGVYGAGGREAVYAANKRHGGLPDIERVFNPDGAVEWEAETEPATIVPPALASDGSGYVVWVNGGAEVIEAINRAGTVRWGYRVPNGAAVTALVAGDDGAAYAAVTTGTGEELLRLSPEDGSVIFAKPLPQADDGISELFAEPNGVAAVSSTHALFLSQQGEITADAEPVPSGFATYWWAPGSSTVTSNNAGDLFVGSAPSTGSGELNTANGIAVTKVEPTGHVAWTAYTPTNGGAGAPTFLAALPDGGLAYDVSSQSIGVLNPDGSSRWSAENHDGYEGRMLTDDSGHLDLASLVNGATCSDNVKNCGGFHLEQLRATNGQVARVVSVVSTKDGDDDWFCGGLALGSQMFYVLDDPTAPGPNSCTPAGKPQLQTYALPETSGPYPTPPATTEPAGEIPPSTYVALGDSYSSGEGNPSYESSTELPGLDECHRSEEVAYSRLLDSALGLGPMTFKACSGAVTDDFFTTNLKNPVEGAQLDWLGPQTTTVTLTIGGDDGGFSYILQHCVEHLNWPPSSWPYIQGFGCAADATLVDETESRLKALEGAGTAFTPPPEVRPIHPLLEVIEVVHADAPNARIIVGGYPQLFGSNKKTYEASLLAPSGRACTVGHLYGVSLLPLLVDYLNAQWLNSLAKKLDAVIQLAVDVARRDGILVSYADPSKEFAGHALCDNGEPWFYPVELTIGENLLPEVEPGTFHPTAEGQILGYAPAFMKALK